MAKNYSRYFPLLEYNDAIPFVMHIVDACNGCTPVTEVKNNKVVKLTYNVTLDNVTINGVNFEKFLTLQEYDWEDRLNNGQSIKSSKRDERLWFHNLEVKKVTEQGCFILDGINACPNYDFGDTEVNGGFTGEIDFENARLLNVEYSVHFINVELL